jgi:DNA-binding response OmpR family regulator
MRILWADDQRGVAESLSLCIGGSKQHRIKYVTDGEMALAELQSTTYDIAMIDLAMPPGKWGGMWLLEQMQEHGVRTPTIVTSGEGTQTETIAASRAGARDYVLKDLADTQLAERLQSVVRDVWMDVQSALLTSVFSPIAFAYRRLESTADTVERVRRVIDIYEWTLRTICLVSLCSPGIRFAVTAPPTSCRLTERPSMGVWSALRSALIGQSGVSAEFKRLLAVFDGRNLDLVIKSRNDLAHGGELTDRTARQWMTEQEMHLRSWLCRIWQILRFEVALVLSSEYDGTSFTHEACLVAGASSVLPRRTFSTKAPLITGRLYLVSKPDDEHAIDLFPLIEATPGQEPKAWELFEYDGVERRKGTPLGGQERLRHVALWSGGRGIGSEGALSSLPNWLWPVV